ncbi:hypothetical protein [Microvirga sp. 17 mud 1-3]|uniref:hypothetical protein n=1 Tax=Microvirga sp. 17 mud 1-3 TaxID=2082949 RepID=UPI0013A53369|nr:hypothetical protein [Microvirga sp. 17 mud 1-3]
MEVSIRRQQVNHRPAMAVYVSGRCVETGLSEQQAFAKMAELLNAQFAEAKSHQDQQM